MEKNNEWFVDWFDSKYYHILYQDRNDDEAKVFMQNITSFLQLKKGSTVLDLACGRGRHSVFLNTLGYVVKGVDLSKNSIEHAKQFENKTLAFDVHDMRLPFTDKYNAIFNLFTSFGYFEDDETNIDVLKNIKNALQENGMAIIDFMNSKQVKDNLIAFETIERDGITFKISKELTDKYIIKHINFTTEGKDHHFTEKVRYLSFDLIKTFIFEAGLQLIHTFGDYELNPFDIDRSNRLILIVKK